VLCRFPHVIIPGLQPRRRLTTLVGTDSGARFLGIVLVNGVLALTLTLVYLGLLFVWPMLGVTSRTNGHFLSTVAIAVLLIPLRQRLVSISNLFLQREWQDYDALLRECTHVLSRTITPSAIAQLMIDDLPSRMRLNGGVLWILLPPEDLLLLPIGADPSETHGALMIDGLGVGLVRSARGYLLIDPHADANWAEPFIAMGARMLIPLQVGRRLVGIYGAGAPLTRHTYPSHVVNLLLTLAPAVASALENVRAYTEIERLNKRLYTLDQLKNDFIESVGHELRTPLTSLSLATQMIEAHPTLATDMQSLLHENVARLRELIGRVLSFDQSNPVINAPSAVVLHPLLADVLDVFVQVTHARGMQLWLDVTPDLAVWGEADRLRRAIHEIVDNAVRYSQHGTIAIIAEVRDGLAVINISDQGTGIPEDEQPQLFDAFFRGRQTRALAVTPGVGLGLSIARREIESLGGRVWLEYTGTDGTIISLSLPSVVSQIIERERAVGE
jgi:signal transduction histidine kinase